MLSTNNQNLLTIGTGAIGTFYSHKFHKAGFNVSVLCRSDYDTVYRDGFKIIGNSSTESFLPHSVINNISDYNLHADYIIIATKYLPEVDIMPILRKVVEPGTVIIVLQNGIYIEEEYFREFPENEIIGGIAYICSSRLSYGIIEHQCGGKLILGTYPQRISINVDNLVSSLGKTGIPVISSDNIIKSRWEKLLWNASFNPVSVLAGGIDTSVILENFETKDLISSIMLEIVKLSKLDNNPVSENLVDKLISNTKDLIPYKTSMLLDYENKRPLEIKAILGNALDIAKKHDYNPPYLRIIYSLLTVVDKYNVK